MGFKSFLALRSQTLFFVLLQLALQIHLGQCQTTVTGRLNWYLRTAATDVLSGTEWTSPVYHASWDGLSKTSFPTWNCNSNQFGGWTSNYGYFRTAVFIPSDVTSVSVMVSVDDRVNNVYLNGVDRNWVLVLGSDTREFVNDANLRKGAVNVFAFRTHDGTLCSTLHVNITLHRPNEIRDFGGTIATPTRDIPDSMFAAPCSKLQFHCNCAWNGEGKSLKCNPVYGRINWYLKTQATDVYPGADWTSSTYNSKWSGFTKTRFPTWNCGANQFGGWTSNYGYFRAAVFIPSDVTSVSVMVSVDERINNVYLNGVDRNWALVLGSETRQFANDANLRKGAVNVFAFRAHEAASCSSMSVKISVSRPNELRVYNESKIGHNDLPDQFVNVLGTCTTLGRHCNCALDGDLLRCDPVALPSSAPTSVPSLVPTETPTILPSWVPTKAPTIAPSSTPTSTPSSIPSNAPTTAPSSTPTGAPSSVPSDAPTITPSGIPTSPPSGSPTSTPTTSPTFPTNAPTSAPTSGPTPFSYIEKQISPTMNGNSFGTSVAMTASRVVVGSPMVNGGALHLWRRSNGTWTAIGIIEPFDREEHATSLFGFSVDISASGHTIVAGAPGSRSVFIYEGRHVWKRTQALRANFGVAVSLSTDTLAVGANGSVSIYTQNSAKEWQFDQELTSLNNATDGFGRWLSLDGTSLAVGAPLDSTQQGTSSGSVYLWEKRGSRWRLSFKLIPSDLRPSDFFGRPVLLKRDFLFVGAHGKGVVYVFRWNGFLWKEQAKVVSWVGCSQLGRGSALAVNDEVSTLVVPCERANLPNVHVFARNGTNWVGQQIIEKNVGGFGSSLDMVNDVIIVGAPGNGSVFSFENRFQTCCGC